MRKSDSMKEAILVHKMKTEDPVELPMEDLFFDQLHNNIMAAVEKTEIKKPTKWQKAQIFLERESQPWQAKARKAAKFSLAAVTLMLGLSVLNYSFTTYQKAEIARLDINKKSILSEAQKNPQAWSQMAANFENENDFYAEVLSQKDTATIVQFDQVLASTVNQRL